MDGVGDYGYYWSSSLLADYGGSYAYYLSFYDGGVGWDGDYYYRYGGYPVRGVLAEN
jgi:hypothetical protein